MFEFESGNNHEHEYAAEVRELASRKEGVYQVLEHLKGMESKEGAGKLYLSELVRAGRSWHVFHVLTEQGGARHISMESYGAILDIAIEQGRVRDIISSWEDMDVELFTEERLIHMRQALNEDEAGKERFDEKFPAIKSL